jgi:putative MATE family efflux protein
MEFPDMTKEVKDLLGDPKKAIVKLSVPMIIGMVILSAYQLADGIWVAGLGSDQLAAVGLFFPFFLGIMALGNGLGMGGSTAIARHLGARKKKDAEHIATHTIFLGILLGLIVTIISIPFVEQLFYTLSGTTIVGSYATVYAQILFSGAIIIIFPCVANAIIRAEGAAKKAVYGLIVGSVANIILDPIFIFSLDLGVAGAAWATLVSLLLSSIIFIYMIFIKQTSFLSVTFKNFRLNRTYLKDILRVGIPSAMTQISISISLFILNIIVRVPSGDEGIAVLTSGWRIMMMGVIPMLGVSPAIESVAGAAFGAKDKHKLKTGFYYAIRFGFIIELIIGVLIFIFAEQIALLFSYTATSRVIYTDLVVFLRITSVYYPVVPASVAAASVFRGMGYGTISLFNTILRVIILQTLFSYVLSILFKLELVGVWIGIVLGALISVIISITWANHTMNGLFK